MERKVAIFTIFGLCAFGIYDISVDFQNEAPFLHLVAEVLTFGMGVVVFSWLSWKLYRMRMELKWTTREAHRVFGRAHEWKDVAQRYLGGVSAAIELEFRNWKLSPAEQDVGLLLLKGFSLKEIADVRKVKERTVRQQSLRIYEKAGVSGRAELSAFFLEDLLAPALEERGKPMARRMDLPDLDSRRLNYSGSESSSV